MGYRELSLNLPVELFDEEMNRRILKKAGVRQGRIQLIRKSLDSRRKDRIQWNIQAGVVSDEIREGEPPPPPRAALEAFLEESRRPRREERCAVVGTGPAGLFASLVLLRLGYRVTLFERGGPVEERARSIERFEGGGPFAQEGNYLFGEGGAGTFSDGKLTSRTKRIQRERDWIYALYVDMGGPEEILWSTHPHLGSDRLYTIAGNMRRHFLNLGGEIRFHTTVTGLSVKNRRVKSLDFSSPGGSGQWEGEEFFMAPGHSSRESYDLLLDRGVPFRPKNFALGFRMEHEQTLINRIQWGREELPQVSLSGIKAAEYRLTHKTAPGPSGHSVPVYTFCMCPGGRVVPAAPYEDVNIVNGMSLYAREGRFANAAVVAGITPEDGGAGDDPRAMLDWLTRLEGRFKELGPRFEAPSCTIGEFLEGRSPSVGESSYPLGLIPWDLASELPPRQAAALKEGLTAFSRRMDGFRQGRLMGFESKTSAPVQVIRDESCRPAGWENLRICGEGSGWAGGIVSSAADGIRAALSLLKN